MTTPGAAVALLGVMTFASPTMAAPREIMLWAYLSECAREIPGDKLLEVLNTVGISPSDKYLRKEVETTIKTIRKTIGHKKFCTPDTLNGLMAKED